MQFYYLFVEKKGRLCQSENKLDGCSVVAKEQLIFLVKYKQYFCSVE